jgi:hypothetical protein
MDNISQGASLSRQPPNQVDASELLAYARSLYTSIRRQSSFISYDMAELIPMSVIVAEFSGNSCQGILLVDGPTNRGPSSPCT